VEAARAAAARAEMAVARAEMKEKAETKRIET